MSIKLVTITFFKFFIVWVRLHQVTPYPSYSNDRFHYLLSDPDKIWKTKISIGFLTLLKLLGVSYIFIASTKSLNVFQTSTDNQTFSIGLPFDMSGNARFKYSMLVGQLFEFVSIDQYTPITSTSSEAFKMNACFSNQN